MTETWPRTSGLWTAAAWLLATAVSSTAAVARHQIAQDAAVSPGPPETADFTGVLRPMEVAVVSLPEPATVDRVAIALGDRVVAGQLLFELNLEAARRRAATLRTALAADEARLARVDRGVADSSAGVQR